MVDSNSSKKILVTGGSGFLGTRVIKKLRERGYKNQNITIPRSREYDLREKDACRAVVHGQNIVIHLAANAGGIGYNRLNPAPLFYDNLRMGTQLLHESYEAGVNKFVGIGTICSYPKFTEVPFKEEYLWKGYPEETNAPYGLAKKMLLVQSQAYRDQYGFNAIHLLPVNLYGPGDRGFFESERAHVIPDMIRKFDHAKVQDLEEVVLWGDGTPTREFLYVEDAAEGIVLATEKYNKKDPINLGSGMEISIKDLANCIKHMTEYEGNIRWDTSKPNGQPRRCLNISKAEREFGFIAKTNFETGLRKTIDWYLNQK